MYPALDYRYAGAAEFFFQGFIREILNCYEKALGTYERPMEFSMGRFSRRYHMSRVALR